MTLIKDTFECGCGYAISEWCYTQQFEGYSKKQIITEILKGLR